MIKTHGLESLEYRYDHLLSGHEADHADVSCGNYSYPGGNIIFRSQHLDRRTIMSNANNGIVRFKNDAHLDV